MNFPIAVVFFSSCEIKSVVSDGVLDSWSHYSRHSSHSFVVVVVVVVVIVDSDLQGVSWVAPVVEGGSGRVVVGRYPGRG